MNRLRSPRPIPALLVALCCAAPSVATGEGPSDRGVESAAVRLSAEQAQRRRVSARLAHMNREPGVQELQRWAAGLADAHPGQLDRLLRDASARAALPLVRLRGRYNDRTNRKWDETDARTARDHDADWTVDLWLEWDLAEAASGGEHLRVLREGRARLELRQALAHEVTVAYFDRRRILLEDALVGPSGPLSERLERQLRVEELDGTLDALTGGQWSAALASPGRASPPTAATGERP